jgi:hypothetical protein
MRSEYNKKLTKCRKSFQIWTSTEEDGYMGFFFIPYKFIPGKHTLKVMSSGPKLPSDPRADILDWEHVSVSLGNRCPTWDEMCFIKNIFWEEDEVVVQYHPAKKDYVNNSPYCLHLWKPAHTVLPTPPSIAVGFTEN